MIEMKNCGDVLKYQSVIPYECTAPLILESVGENGVLGYIIFEYLENEVVIYAVDSSGDLALCDGLVRAAMFKAVLSRIEFARFSLKSENAVQCCKKLGFIKDDSLQTDINEVLNACKGCGKS